MRWIQIAVIVLVPVGRAVARAVKARRANAALATGLLQAPPAGAETRSNASAEELAQLRQRFEQALGLLRKLRFGTEKPSLWARLRSLGSQQYLYGLPWYVFIGAPGSGKTTALINSGLRFPLADRLGREAVRGVGGTRNCDWWFTDEALFLDTAGRYTTQQSDQGVDAAAWKGFLQLLKKSRPRRPINGVLVTVSVGDLLQQSSAEADLHAQALRARVQELYTELGVSIPIYVLVTKSDLLAGFTEFFATLGKDERAQAWGFSRSHLDQGLDAASLSTELERLERRLYERLPDRLEEERDPARRALLYSFPQQFALVRGRLVHLIEATFAPNTFQATPRLRGVYFTSGTQEGSPIDRVMGSLARDLGIERKLLPAQYPSGRSYFLTRLLREVVFPEAGLAGLDLRGERRRQWLHAGVLGVAAAALILATLAWWISYSHNREYLAEVATQVKEVKQQIPPSGAKNDASEILPTLTIVRSLSEARATADGSVPWTWRFGLYQGGKIEAASRAVYQRMLQDTFLPSLAAYLERYLVQGSSGGLDDSYDALKTYTMLYDPKRFNREAVWRWYQTHGDQLLPGADRDAQKALRAHFEALYERGWVDPAVPRNDELLRQRRADIGRDSLPKRIYDRLKREPVPELRDFTIVEKAGPHAMLVFERVSREPLTKGVPALYTKDGYYKHFARKVDLTALQFADEERWVLGTDGGALAGVASAAGVAEAVKRFYLEDYRRIWRQFIGDIAVIKSRDLTRTIELTRTLSAPDTSPLKPLAKAIERETSLSVPPEGEPGLAGRAKNILDKAKVAVAGGPLLEKTLVDDHFEDIRRFAGAPGGSGPAPVDVAIQQLNEFYQLLIAAKFAFDAAQTPPPTEGANKLRAEAARQPEPIRSMLEGLVEGGTRQIREKTIERQAEENRQLREKQTQEQRLMNQKQADEQRLASQKQADEQRLAREKQATEIRQTRERIDAELRSQIADFCVRATRGRYPFDRTSALDVPPEDFARLFAPGGLLDGFFQKHLAPHVDTTQKPWRFREPAMGQSPTLADFQRAQVIRDVFFRGGGNTPSIVLEFKPLEMDAKINQFLLDVDGKIVRYAHGPQVPVRVQFPGPGGRSQVRVSITPPPPSGSSGKKFEGPWALFRMFDGVKIEETNQSERFVTTIDVEGRRTVFEMLASSVRNPFRLPELGQFRCPTAL